MKIEINLPKKLYEEIKELCEYNKISVEKYLCDCISDSFYTLKYGDLNLKIGNENKDTKVNEAKIEDAVVEKKKVGRPRKKVETCGEVKNAEVSEKEEGILNKNGSNTDLVKKDDVLGSFEENTENKIKRTKRVLKIK